MEADIPSVGRSPYLSIYYRDSAVSHCSVVVVCMWQDLLGLQKVVSFHPKSTSHQSVDVGIKINYIVMEQYIDY